jgi:CheY-like chemotaxis protein
MKYALEHEVDVALMDVRMLDGDGLTALGRIKLDKPGLPILMFSAFDKPTAYGRATLRVIELRAILDDHNEGV